MNEYFIEGIQVSKAQSLAYSKLSEEAKKTYLRDLQLARKVVPAVVDGKMSAVEATLAERGSRYGDFTDHAQLCQDLQDVMRSFRNKGADYCSWQTLSPVQKQALTVIADKIARILSGDPNYADNWHDIQGYAKLVEDRLPQIMIGHKAN
jgi:hypothetical protein